MPAHPNSLSIFLVTCCPHIPINFFPQILSLAYTGGGIYSGQLISHPMLFVGCGKKLEHPVRGGGPTSLQRECASSAWYLKPKQNTGCWSCEAAALPAAPLCLSATVALWKLTVERLDVWECSGDEQEKTMLRDSRLETISTWRYMHQTAFFINRRWY